VARGRRSATHCYSQYGVQGIPERVAMTISDQKTRSVLDCYKIVSKSDLHEAAKKLAQQDQERDALQPIQTN
jgi:hypothetical protein